MNNIVVNESCIFPSDRPSERLEHYALKNFGIYHTRNGVKKAIKRGEIRVNGKMRETGYWLKPGQIIEIVEIPGKNPGIFKLPLKIIYEDDWIAVIEKPPGFPVNGNQYKTIENALPYNLEPSNASDALKYPRPVHRLDNPTGGLLLIAKSSRSISGLGWQFEKRIISKKYRAIVMGKLEGNGKVSTSLDNRESLTYYNAVYSCNSMKSEYLTVVDLRPETGRTHQLRRHMSEIGHPILGDSEYGVEGNILKGKGLFLWATELAFNHPIKNRAMIFNLKEPAKFSSRLKKEKEMWLRAQKF